MADQQKKAKFHPLALAEIVGSGGFTHYATPEEGEDASPPDDLPEGASVEDQKEETVKLRDGGHDQETGEEQQVVFLKITNLDPLSRKSVRTGVPKPDDKEHGASDGGAEKKTTAKKESADS